MLGRGSAQFRAVQELSDAGRFRAALALLGTHQYSETNATPEALVLWAELAERTGKYEHAAKLAARVSRLRDAVPTLAARALLVEGAVAQHKGHRSKAAAAFNNAAEVALTGGDAAGLLAARVRAMRVVEDGPSGTVAFDVGDLEREILRTGNRKLAVTFHIYRAELEAKAGRLRLSEEHTRTAESLLEDVDHPGLSGLVQVHRSCLTYLRGHFSASHTHARAAFAAAQESGHHCTLCVSLTNLGAAYLALGQPRRAELVLQRALELAQPGTTVYTLSLETLAEVWLASKNLDQCGVLMDEVDQRKHAAGQEFSAWHEAWTLATRVRLMQARGDWAGSLELLHRTGSSVHPIRATPILERMILLEVAALTRLGRLAEASQAMERLDRQAPARSPLMASQATALAACLNRRLGNGARAAYQFRIALGLLSVAGEPADMVQCVEEYADLLSAEHLRDSAQLAQLGPPLPSHRPTTVYSGLRRSTPLAGFPREDLSDAVVGLLGVSAQREQHPHLIGELALRLLYDSGAIRNAVLVESESGVAERVLCRCEAEVPIDSSIALKVDLGWSGSRRFRLEVDLASTLEAAETGRAMVAFLGIPGASNGLRMRGDAEVRSPRSESPEAGVPAGMVFASTSMKALLSTARRNAATEAPILITGESGTGKEVLARFVHATSRRSAAVFLPFNCATIPRDLIESQLFGFRRGAFTGADQSFAGVIRSAVGGTLFLDEISELPLDVQPKLLRFLDSREVHALGEARPATADVRVVAASNVELADLVASGRFRGDLYYRLNVLRMRIPPLRDRRADIEVMIDNFLRDNQEFLARRNISLSRAARARLMLYDWPGNVRELASEIFRLVAQAVDDQTLECDALSPEVRSQPGAGAVVDTVCMGEESSAGAGRSLRSLLEEVERQAVSRAIDSSNGSQTEAARRLGVSRKGLYLKRQRLGL